MSEQQVNEATASEMPASEMPANDLAANDAPAAPVEQAATPETAPEAAPAASADETGADKTRADETSTGETSTGETSTGETSTGEASADESGAPVVRMLSVGQQVKGTVKRITEFGAFVDIGVGRDGLVHISELSAKRVGKVSDVLQEGQEVQLWIKKLDRDRNRISLTMIEPGKRTIRDLQKGEVVEGTVTRMLPYGAFIDIGIGRDALLHVREMGEGFIAKPEDVVQVGQTVEVRVIDIARRRSRVDLSMKGLRPEPEVQAPAHQEHQENQGRQEYQGRYEYQGRQGRQEYQGRQGRQPEPEPEPELEVADEFADMEVLTPMQLAFKRAQEKSGVVLPTGKPGKNNKRQDTAKKRAQQEDIMARTLNTGKK